MQRAMPGAVQLNWFATAFRLLVVVLAILAVVLGGQFTDSRLLPLGAIYLVATGIFWLLGSRLAGSTHVIPAVDVAAVTAMIALLPA